nr:hypothetical protein [Tanacetum cinerariifolium]
MSDSEDSMVTYTEVSSRFEDLSDIGSPRVVVYRYEGLSMHVPSPEYVPSPEQPPSPVYVPYVSEPAYPDFMPPEDDVLPAKEQPLPDAVSPTSDSPRYITESNPEEELEEDDEDSEEDPTEYPTDRDDDEEEEESSGDDADDEEKDEDEDKEEEEHLAPIDSVPPPAYHTIARMSIRAQTSIPLLSETEVARLLAIPTPPPSPLTPYSSPLPHIPSPSLPASLTHPLGYRAAMIRLRAESPSTSHPLPLSPPIVGECSSALTARPTGGFRADYGFVGTLDAKIRRDPDREIGYEITDVWEDPYEIAEEKPTTDVAKLSKRITDFVTIVRQDTDEIYRRLDDVQDDRLLMSEALTLLKTLQTQMVALQSQQTPARDPSHPNIPEEAVVHFTKMATKRTTRSSPATTTTTTTPVTNAQLKTLIDQGVADALVARDAEKSQNGEDSHDSGMGVRREAPLARECTYPNFIKCKPLYFKGTKGVVELNQWFKRMETVFRLRNYTVENLIKFATCILLGSALTWWNSHVKTVGPDVAYVMTWTNVKKKMTNKYCPRGEIKKLKVEMWNLKVKGTDVVSYNQHFQELALMCARMFPKESDKIKRYVDGFPDMIHGSTENRRKSEDTAKNNQNQQQQNKRQNTGRAYIAGSKLGSFDVIIGMDCLEKYQVVIVCAEKIVGIPWGNETLIIRRDGNNWGNKTRLNIISCTKTQNIHGSHERVCTPYLDKIVIVFNDDILIYSRNKKEHKEHFKAIPELLKKEELYAKFSKCEFWIPKVQFLGHMTDSQGIHMDPAKIESIKDWASPKIQMEIRQF